MGGKRERPFTKTQLFSLEDGRRVIFIFIFLWMFNCTKVTVTRVIRKHCLGWFIITACLPNMLYMLSELPVRVAVPAQG